MACNTDEGAGRKSGAPPTAAEQRTRFDSTAALPRERAARVRTREEATGLVRRFEGYVVDYAEKYLIPSGWFASIASRRSEDLEGPVPWITYPALRVLPQLLQPSFRVLEYGSGGSSLWFGRRVAQVVSVEHNPSWARWVAGHAGVNNVIVEIPDGAALEPEFLAATGSAAGRVVEGAAYAAEILRYPQGYFDVVYIDGIARPLCVQLALPRLSGAGFILFDNSDRKMYAPAYEVLRKAGYRRIDFWGTGPVNAYEWCTSVFVERESGLL